MKPSGCGPRRRQAWTAGATSFGTIGSFLESRSPVGDSSLDRGLIRTAVPLVLIELVNQLEHELPIRRIQPQDVEFNGQRQRPAARQRDRPRCSRGRLVGLNALFSACRDPLRRRREAPLPLDRLRVLGLEKSGEN